MTSIQILPELSGKYEDRRDPHAAADPAEQRLVPEREAEQKEARSQKSGRALLVEADQAEEAGDKQQMLKDHGTPVEAGRDGKQGVAREQRAGRRSRATASNPERQAPEQPNRKAPGQNNRRPQGGCRRLPEAEYWSVNPG